MNDAGFTEKSGEGVLCCGTRIFFPAVGMIEFYFVTGLPFRQEWSTRLFPKHAELTILCDEFDTELP